MKTIFFTLILILLFSQATLVDVKSNNLQQRESLFVKNIEIPFRESIIQQKYIQEWRLIDPEDDDRGIGTLIYPTNGNFTKGVFDLTGFTIRVDEDYIYFITSFKYLGSNPWNGRNGFSLQYIQIYVLTTRRDLPKQTTSFGLNIIIQSGWHYAILVNGGWGDKPLPGGELPAIYDWNRRLLTYEGELYDVYVDESQPNTIVAKINKTILVDTENIGNWKIVVAVASYDGFVDTKVRNIKAGDPEEWVFGGADEQALKKGVHPFVIDLLAPTADLQYVMLTNWDIEQSVKPLVSSIIVSTGELDPPVVITTPTPTPTPTLTTITTPTQTQTLTPTLFPTETEIESFVSTPERSENMSLLLIPALLIVAVLIITMFMYFRRKQRK